MQLADVYAADDLAVAALWLAAQDVVSLDVEPYIDRLDGIADQLRVELGSARDSDGLPMLARLMARSSHSGRDGIFTCRRRWTRGTACKCSAAPRGSRWRDGLVWTLMGSMSRAGFSLESTALSSTSPAVALCSARGRHATTLKT